MNSDDNVKQKLLILTIHSHIFFVVIINRACNTVNKPVKQNECSYKYMYIGGILLVIRFYKISKNFTKT